MAVTVTYALDHIGPDLGFQANTWETGASDRPDALGLSNGGFVVAYNASDGSGGAGAIALDFYDAESNHLQLQFAYASGTTDAEGQPKLSELDGGHVLVVWDDENNIADRAGPRASIYTAAGGIVAEDIDLIAGAGQGSASFVEVDTAAMDNGGFVVSYALSGDIFFRRYDSAGVEQGSVVTANTVTTGVQVDTQVTVLADGAIAVAWTDTNPGDQPVKGRIFEADGTPRTAELNLAPGTGDNTQPSIAALKGGGFVVVYADTGWNEAGGLGGGGLTMHLVSAAGAVGTFIHVNTSSPANELDPDVTVLENGFIAVTWTYPVGGSDKDIRCRVFDPNGVPVTGLYSLDLTSFDEEAPAISALLEGRFLTAWQDEATDGSGNSVSAQISELTRTVFGDSAPDSFQGDLLRDSISGGIGADTLKGGAGNDSIDGGSEFDVIWGEAGNDLLQGGLHSDTLIGGFGNDVIYAVTAADPGGSMAGDSLYGDAGRDKLRGSAAANVIDGGTGDDKAYGGGGHDQIALGDGDDKAEGSTGDDSIFGAAGADKLRGQSDDDVLLGGADGDTLNGGAGDDLLYAMTGADVGGSAAGDALNGANGNDTIWGSAGGDTVAGGGGNDNLDGGAGSDLMIGAAGTDVFNGGAGDDTLEGGAGKDVFRYAAVADSVPLEFDVIVDLDAMDVINLSGIDAKVGKPGDQAFELVSAFTGKAGELVLQSTGGGTTALYGDVDGDSSADVAILLVGDHSTFDRIVL